MDRKKWVKKFSWGKGIQNSFISLGHIKQQKNVICLYNRMLDFPCKATTFSHTKFIDTFNFLPNVAVNYGYCWHKEEEMKIVWI